MGSESEEASPTAIVVSAEDTVKRVYSLTEDNLERGAPWSDTNLRISIDTHPVKARRDSVVSEDMGISPLSSEATIFDIEVPHLPEWKTRIRDLLKNR